jgi:hypothetical protein
MMGITFAACGPPHGQPFQSCDVPADGILLLRWTVRGAAPSAASCAGVDHLVVSVSTQACGGASIEPVPCALDKFRYDNFPRGAADVAVTAVDAHDATLLSGSTTADLEPNASAPPASLDLR